MSDRPSAAFDLSGVFPTVETVGISYLEATPGDGYPAASLTWEPLQGDRLPCSNRACVKGGVWVQAVLAPLVATGQAKAVRKTPCSGQERVHPDGFKPCPNSFMLAVSIGYRTGEQ